MRRADNGRAYPLIPHDMIKDNMTLKGLAASCTYRGNERAGRA